MEILLTQTPEQIAQTAKMAKEIWSEHYRKIIGPDVVADMVAACQSEEAIAQKIKSGYRYYLVRKHDRYAAYFAILKKADGMYLDKAYVYREFRKQGIFSKILSFVEAECKNQGLKRIYLNVNSKNEDSIAAYRAKGFVPFATAKNDFGNGHVFTDFVMEKQLLLV